MTTTFTNALHPFHGVSSAQSSSPTHHHQHKTNGSSTTTTTNGHALIVEISPSCCISLQTSLGPSDRLASLLLQCAFELRRDHELQAFAHYYSSLHRPLPFPVALIWWVNNNNDDDDDDDDNNNDGSNGDDGGGGGGG